VLAPAETDHLRDLLRALGQDHRVRRALVEGVHVALVGEPGFRRRRYAARAHDPLELAKNRCAQGHARLRDEATAKTRPALGGRAGGMDWVSKKPALRAGRFLPDLPGLPRHEQFADVAGPAIRDRLLLLLDEDPLVRGLAFLVEHGPERDGILGRPEMGE